MPSRIKIFLAYPFDGIPEPPAYSNWDVGQWFKREIERIGNQTVEVLSTRNPTDAAISETVKGQIDGSDAVICLFCKRTWDHVPQKWSTSPYVVSESGYAASRFRYDAQKRLFGFMEHGVDRSSLGMAFPGDRSVPEFNRSNLADILPDLEKVIHGLREQTSYSSEAPEPLLLHKTVQVRRDGRARIETCYQFRIRKDMHQFRMGHSIWRVKEALPALETMLESAPGDSAIFFRCVPWVCGRADTTNLVPEFAQIRPASHKKEIGFDVKFPKIPLKAGDLVEYQLTYSYDKAFFHRKDLAEWEKNSTGLRTGGRGPVAHVVLTVMFERNWHGPERIPAIETQNGDLGPKIAIANETSLPGNVDPREFWHQSADWRAAGCMQPIQSPQFPLFEVYEWRSDNFSGTARAIWDSSLNYHQSRGGPHAAGYEIPKTSSTPSLELD